jgi:hypothetical protein
LVHGSASERDKIWNYFSESVRQFQTLAARLNEFQLKEKQDDVPAKAIEGGERDRSRSGATSETREANLT